MSRFNVSTRLAAWLLALFVMPMLAIAEEEGGDDKDGEDKAKSVADVTKDHSSYEGLLTLYRDDKTGALKLSIKPELLGEEMIYFAQAADGVVQTGYFRGAYLANDVITFERRYDHIDVVKQNTSYYFDPDNALSRAASANISNALIATAKILAEDDSAIVIDADPLFKTETMLQIKPSSRPNDDPRRFKLGSLSGETSRVLNVRSYPNNTDVEAELIYSNPTPTGSTGGDITDDRFVAVRIFHSIIAMPDNDYQPRMDDPRVGYFLDTVTDLTSFSATPYRDMITRWDLQKKYPEAALSEPVEPITFWIENTTPVEYRELIRDAALGWNSAFEKAGFKNAVVVKIQPDDATWDAGDIRYNVLRWTSSPNPPFGGYGPSFSNPRTGQTLGADIMLEYSFLNRYAYARHLINDADTLLDSRLPPMHAHEFCSLADGLKSETAVGRALLAASGEYDAALDVQIVHDAMHYLILHEIGHTLGLNHNMKATQLLSPDEAADADTVAAQTLSGSVMDYPAVNFIPGGPQTRFYSVAPGPYDDWAIQFGYDPSLADPAKRAAHLARSSERELAFGNDADDMRSAGKAIDPRVNIYDMSSDAIGYADRRMQTISDGLARLASDLPDDGKSYQETHDLFVQMIRSWARNAAVTSRYIGGVYLNRAMVGQPGAGAPYTPVEEDTQRRALEVLSRQVFAPNVMASAEPAFRYIARQRRGFNFFSGTEDPKIHAAALTVQGAVLDHLLHPAVMQRLTDTALYGNTYTLAEHVDGLTDAVFAADARGDVNSVRQNLQVDYVERLAKIVNGEGFDNLSQSAALLSLQNVDRLMARKRTSDLSTRAHVAHVRLIIERALEASRS
ncbi:MAG: zinc-dependent metalloprotease [Pseudomonadota bacterium]